MSIQVSLLPFSCRNLDLDLKTSTRVKAVIQPNGDSSAKAETLRNEGVEVHEVEDLTAEKVFEVLDGCHACFLATKTAFTEPNFQFNEVCLPIFLFYD